MTSHRFSGQTVIVTGAAFGIGRAIADAFCAEGATVYGFDVDAAGLSAASTSINTRSFKSVIADVSQADQVTAGVSTALQATGSIDVLVNNAGINLGKRIDTLEVPDWDRVMDVNLKSVYLMSKAVWGAMSTQRAGAIVNIASIMGQVGGVGAPAYCAGKAAIIMLSRCLAKDGAPLGIRVNSVCPGYVDTPIMDRVFAADPNPEAARAVVISRQPMGRFARPNEIANGVMFLASSEATFISGTELTIDGAVTATQIDG
jgi:NAD(P)-dependent dehydrogenase (short-subunit alcohol dehydrogenase family)